MSIRENPFDEMERMFDQMRRSMWAPYGGESPYGGQSRSGQFRGERDAHDSHVDIETSDEGYVVFADMPGFEKEDIDLRFEDDVLTIEATHEYADDHSSRSRRVFERVRVPGDVLEDEITATYRNGVLEVHLPAPETVEDEDSTSIDID